jgi:hypothetical protein
LQKEMVKGYRVDGAQNAENRHKAASLGNLEGSSLTWICSVLLGRFFCLPPYTPNLTTSILSLSKRKFDAGWQTTNQRT